jgi:glycosyl transferase family 1
MPAVSTGIGIVDQSQAGWTAGATYTRMLVQALHAAGVPRDRLFLLTNGTAAVDGMATVLTFTNRTSLVGSTLARVPGALGDVAQIADRIAVRIANRWRPALYRVAREHAIDVLLPLQIMPASAPPVATISWIPDFQHVRRPEFFPPEERRDRDERFAMLAANASLVMLSSESALADFRSGHPAHADKGRVARFPSLFGFEPPSGTPGPVADKYRLPSKFALVVNQFWTHKNHLLLVRAAAEARRAGVDVPIVLAGTPADARAPTNPVVSEVMQAISQHGLRESVIVLGQVPRSDLIDLLRTTALIIQPSKFEGWNTTVQDALALGKPLLCSDIEVHREQAPASLGFFGVDRPDELAGLLARQWPTLPQGHLADAEAVALRGERDRARAYGAHLLSICEEAVARFRSAQR